MDAGDSNSLAELVAHREVLSTALLSHNTQRGYSFDWRAFTRWCERFGRDPLPASTDTVSLHITEMLHRKLKVASCARRAAAISYYHRAGKFESPVTPNILTLLRAARRIRRDQVRRVRPLSLDELRAIVQRLGAISTPMAIRNRAILLTAFASALRAANLVSLTFDDVEFVTEGAVLTVWHEKTNQDGPPRLIGMPHAKHSEACPVQCLREWIATRGIFPGPLFTRFDRPALKSIPLQPERICQIVQESVTLIGLDPKLYGGHTPRRSLITEAVRAGSNELSIMGQSGHKDRKSLASYFERDVWRANVCFSLDL